MLHRPCITLRFIDNLHRFDRGLPYVVGSVLAKRNSGSLITTCNAYKKVCIETQFGKSFNIHKVHCACFQHSKWTLSLIFRSSSSDIKLQNEGGADNVQQSKSETQPKGQRIIKLSEENLGQLKERVLADTPPVNQTKLSPEHNEDVKPKINGDAMLKAEATNAGNATVSNTSTKAAEDVALKKAKKRLRVDRTVSSLERNFITPIRAMSDFLLKPSDLENLPKTKRRSPYEFEPPITVYWRKDVEAKAMEVWGSREALLKELMKKEVQKRAYQQDIFALKRRLKDDRREGFKDAMGGLDEGIFGRSGRVVLTAIAINASNFLCKLFAWICTGSHSMFAECIHSAADTCNQIILAYGIHKSVQTPDPDHPYGYTNMRYVSSLISGVGIFCVGTGLSVYHGIHGLIFPGPTESFYWAYFILAGSFVSEGATLLVAIQSIKKGAEEKKQSFKDYVVNGQDPSVNVVLMEDFAAVIGLVAAAACMGLTSYFNNPMYDAVGSLVVGGLLGAVATFIILTNVAALTGRSVSQDYLEKINAELESDIMVRAIHDIKGIDMGNNLVRYKAELDFDGRELMKSYLEKQDVHAMFKEVKDMKDIDELEEFLLKHGENVVDMMGGEIDRIEMKLKKTHPEIRHCDLEIL